MGKRERRKNILREQFTIFNDNSEGDMCQCSVWRQMHSRQFRVKEEGTYQTLPTVSDSHFYECTRKFELLKE